MDASPSKSRGVKIQRRPVHGVLLLDKPLGMSSTQALQKAKWLLRAEKAGHTGTLDPLATGVLPLCFGAATKFSQVHLDADKSYEALLKLGIQTSSADAEGEVTQTHSVPVLTHEDLMRVAARLTGPQKQVPPMYSALKKDGKALYEYARAGQTIEREARDIIIHSLTVTQTEQVDVLKLVVTCSKGTYIRTLGESVAQELGTVGHLVALRRVGTGPFAVNECIDLNAFEQLDESSRMRHLKPVQTLLQGDPCVQLPAQQAGRFLSGVRLSLDPSVQACARVQVWGEEPRAFLGTAHIQASSLIPQRLLSPIEVGQILQTS